MNPPTTPQPQNTLATYTKPKRIKDPLLKQVLNYLSLHYNLYEAYLLSQITTTTQMRFHYLPDREACHTTATYTLLLITTKASPPLPEPHQLMDALCKLTQKQAQVYAIHFSHKAVCKKLKAGHNFLSKTIGNAPCIYKGHAHSEAYTIPTPRYHERVWKAIYREWGMRLKRADALYESLCTLNTVTEPTAYFTILHHVLTQTCLGLIYVFMEYRPSHTALPYLLHLCSLFTDLPETIFPKNSYRNQHLLHHLYNAQDLKARKTQYRLNLHDAHWAWKKCGVFLYTAETLVERYFDTRVVV